MSDPKREPLRTITISVFAPNDFTIAEGERSCDRLCWDEMLGTVAEITHPKIGEARYRMMTPAEHAEYNARFEKNADKLP